VTANPEPDDTISLDNRQRAVSEAYPRGIDILVALELLKLQARMPRILLKNSIGALGVPLNVWSEAAE
jgi:hypothetical protein